MLSTLKGQSRIHRLRNRSSWHIRGLPGSTVIGITRWDGSTLPTSPQTRLKRIIGHSLEDSSRNKVTKTGTRRRVRKTDPRGGVRMIWTALEGATERDKKLLHPNPFCDVPQNLRSLWMTLQDDLPEWRAGTQVTGHKTIRCRERLNPAKPF